MIEDELLYTGACGHSLWSANQLPAREVISLHVRREEVDAFNVDSKRVETEYRRESRLEDGRGDNRLVRNFWREESL